jgi:hypothetical protein
MKWWTSSSFTTCACSRVRCCSAQRAYPYLVAFSTTTDESGYPPLRRVPCPLLALPSGVTGVVTLGEAVALPQFLPNRRPGTLPNLEGHHLALVMVDHATLRMRSARCSGPSFLWLVLPSSSSAFFVSLLPRLSPRRNKERVDSSSPEAEEDMVPKYKERYETREHLQKVLGSHKDTLSQPTPPGNIPPCSNPGSDNQLAID